MAFSLSRRRFVVGVGTLATSLPLMSSHPVRTAFQNTAVPILSGSQFNLNLAYQKVNYTGAERFATTINNSLPAPTLLWNEGDRVTLSVTNHLAHDSAIHWHGILLPSDMDGVPGLSFGGIHPNQTFRYQFDVRQSGTYWYHSHSGFQEQTGLYGAIIIRPKQSEPFRYDRDYVVVLSEWTDESPYKIFATLKKSSEYYRIKKRTAKDLFAEVKEKGVAQTFSDRRMWSRMRMSDYDISDVTGHTYTFLMNGKSPTDGWVGLFKKGEKIRLRFINAGAMTFFDVRIPGLKMAVVAADGQYIEPILVDDLRIGAAETYDVIVEPKADSAYTIFAQAIDRSGFARGILTPDPQLQAEVPMMDPTPVLTHQDMGVAHGSHNGHVNDDDRHHAEHPQAMDKGHSRRHVEHQGMSRTEDFIGSGKAGYGSARLITTPSNGFGLQVDMRAEDPQYRLDDPGVGLRDHRTKYGRRVLTYADLRNLSPMVDQREPKREIELHLMGNMYRYMWSFDGVRYADAKPITLQYGERVRFVLVNDTMMNHPIHLHGMWSELETGDNVRIPRKHTVVVQPGSKISYLVTASAKGRWAYHCHLLYHMAGMFREVYVS